jgi:hypothetical protein
MASDDPFGLQATDEGRPGEISSSALSFPVAMSTRR